MNYGAEPADQVVRYSLEGMEYSLKNLRKKPKREVSYMLSSKIR